MDVKTTDLNKNLPAFPNSPVINNDDWLTRIDKIVGGINKLMESYKQIQGKTPEKQTVMDTPLSFGEAREIKKLEMAKPQGNTMQNEIKGLILSLVKACDTLETMGYGERKVGEAFCEMPVSVSQAKIWLQKQVEKGG